MAANLGPGPIGRAIRVGPPAAVLAAVVAAALLAGGAGDAGAARAKVLGKTKQSPKPKCPAGGDCFAMGSVTGIQLRASGKRRPFKVPSTGHIVAWSVHLSNKPTKSQLDFFGDTFKSKKFGRGPTGRIAILKPVGKRRYKLKRQSPVLQLSRHFGEKPIFTLDDPLRAKKGWVVAFTTMTWTTNLVLSDRARDSKWRASRKKGECGARAGLKARPQKKVGSTRQYGCAFTDRIMYWAYLVPQRR